MATNVLDNFRFEMIELPTPEVDEIAQRYAQIEKGFDHAHSDASRREHVRKWDRLRRELDTWESWVNLRFQQDTRDPARQQLRDTCDRLRPKFRELESNFKKKLLASAHRPALEAEFGRQALALWELSASTYAPAIEQDMVRESQLEGAYTELLAAAELEFQGSKYNLSEIVKFAEHPDRDVRHAAERCRWDWFDAQRPRLDDLYDQLVKLRAEMARKLGFPSFVELGYARMARVDYTRADVDRFRAAVREHVVPWTVALRREQAARLGVEPLMFWDAALHDPQGNPAPTADYDALMEGASRMFRELSPGLSELFEKMRQVNLMDLRNREGKAGGGFCTSLVDFNVPYIFANFNGTKHDVQVFTHEMGHAYQNYCSIDLPLVDYAWPTSEAAEIHSMGLEFLTWPQMGIFFGADADRFRRIHLEQSLLFIPYGVAVDHFQHLVYERPDATPDERHALWQEMERLYLPWCAYGDLAHCARGGRWQALRHIYLYPFYYLDYTLALTCALQLWMVAQDDPSAALGIYEQLCERGGSDSFQRLVTSSGLVSPFQPGCVAALVARLKALRQTAVRD